MNILVIAEKKQKAQPFIEAIREKGSVVKYIRVSKITLVSKQNETLIKVMGQEIPIYDAVFIQVRASLAPFIEPLLDEFQNQQIYTTAKKGAYFIAHNEPYQFVTLSTAEIPSPRTFSSGSVKNIEKISKKISYPLMAKTFIGKKAQQALIVNNSKELNIFIKSIKTEIDGFMLREYIEADAISCAVIGRKVYAIRRKNQEGTIAELNEGESYKVTENEEKTALAAAHAGGFDIARVDLAKGRVVKIDPVIPIEEFNKICSERLEEHVANFLIEKAEQHESKRKVTYDLFGLKKILSKTIFRGLFK